MSVLHSFSPFHSNISSSVEDWDDPLNCILHIGNVHATTRRRTRESALAPGAAEAVVSRPYAEIFKELDTNEGSVEDVLQQLASKLKPLKDLCLSLTLEELSLISPETCSALKKVFINSEKEASSVLAVQDKLFNNDSDCAYVFVTVNHTRVTAILDTGAPENIVSSKLMKAMKLCPDVNYDKTFGTAGPNATQALGAYSALSLCFGRLVVQSPAIVLKNDNYDLLIGTSFLRKWKCKLDLDTNIFHFGSEKIPIFYSKNKPVKLAKNIHWINMQFDQGVFPIECNVLYPQVVDPPLAVFARDGIPI